MRLSKLAILGFKSFADKTVLHFDAGITCIVGPNGCGKSNISDAFRWVLGEQSAKSMRGAKMPDVIFAGASQRHPLNMAEVSLTLTDLQGALPIDYEEITITRRLYRNGESEYLLNGNLIRLKDLQTLLLDSGVGRNSFSIFEQGKLDQVINYSPHERRYIFEEAAGILRFLQRKKEALKRLEQADLNLARVKDIHHEIEKQIQTLETQARKAKIFREQKNELEQLEKLSYVLRWQGIEKKLVDLNSKHVKQNEKLENSRRQGESLHAQCQQAKQARQQHENSHRSQNEKLLTLRGRLELMNHDCMVVQQRIKEMQQREKKLKQESEDLALARQSRKKMLSDLMRKRQQLEVDWSEAESDWIKHQDRVSGQEKEVSRLRLELAQKQQVHLKSVHQHSQWQSDLKQAEVRLENLNEHQKQMEIRYQQLKSDWQQLCKSVQERKNHLKQISELVDAHKDRLNQQEEDLKILVREGEKKQKEIEALNKKIIEIKARQKVLLHMREDHDGFSSGSKTLLKEAQNSNSPLYNLLRPFYEFFKPQSEVVEALAIVLRAYAQTLVVERADDFKRIVDFAEKIGLQDYSLLCLDWLQDSKDHFPDHEKSLLDKVSSNSLARHFLGTVTFKTTSDELFNSWLVGKGDEGWSLQGTFIDHRGVFFKIKPSENQVFIRESELGKLEEDINFKEEELAKLEQSYQQLQHRRSHLQLERTELDKIIRRDEIKLVEVNYSLQKSLSDQEKNKSDQMQCEAQLASFKQNIELQKQSYQSTEKQFALVKEDLALQLQDKDILQQDLNKHESAWRLLENNQKEKGIHYQQLTDHRQQLIHQFDLLEVKDQDHEKQVERIKEELHELEDRKNQSFQEESNGRKNLSEIEAQLQESAEQFANLEKQKDGIFQVCDKADAQLALHLEESKQIEYGIAQLSFQINQQIDSSKAIAAELEDRYQMNMEEALKVNLPLNRSLDQIERQMRGLRQSLQDSGNVNLAAIEELEQHQVRFAFLKQQIDDMQQSKDELLKIIHELDRESHHLFKETFESIRTNFKKNFQILFNGGEADLQFTDSQDILEAGIEITAKPPGKQMRSITLLSGGEKCLTAVALLFAIFEVKPAPFCILDEIDAPLDDTNVDRFVNVVKHFVDRCQFIIITHNKRTMSIGDVLFGVSMEEKGVSKLLSLEFAHREEPAASLV